MDAISRPDPEYHAREAKAHKEEYRRLRNQGTPDFLMSLLAGLLTFAGAMALLAVLYLLLPVIYPISHFILGAAAGIAAVYFFFRQL